MGTKHILKGMLIMTLVFMGISGLTTLAKADGDTTGGSGKKTYFPLVSKSYVPIGSQWFVSPSGHSSGNGSQSNPWDLQTALNQPSSVKPGDTIWLRGGRYIAPFKSHLKGASGKPIIVRAYPGERATLDGTGPILTIQDSSWVYYGGFEITKSTNTRPYSSSPNPEHGILTSTSYSSSNLKFINLVIHDVPGAGMAWWRTNTDSEVYGSLIYNNGVMQLDHGIYTQNESGTKRITNNILFDNASHGIHVYTSGSSGIDNYIISGNTVFDNGAVGINTSTGAKGAYVRNILVGGALVTHNSSIMNNYSYFPSTDSNSMNLGYSTGSSNTKVLNNYFMAGKFTIGGSTSGLSFSGNTIYGGLEGFSTSGYSANTYLSGKPGGLKYFVQPNQYEPGRANLTVFNWAKAATVTLPASALSGVQIQAGDRYELHNVLNFYGDVIKGTYNGSSLPLPMTGRSVANAVGSSLTMPNTFPEFGVFVLIDLGK